MLHGWLLARLRRMLGPGCDFFAAVFLFLLHFFVVRDIAWIGHEKSCSTLTTFAVGQRADRHAVSWAVYR